MVVLCAGKAFIECSSQSSTCSRVLTRRGRAGVLLKTGCLLKKSCECGRVERPGNAERSGKCPPLVCKLEATHLAMQVGASTRQAGEAVGDASILDHNDAQQLGFFRARTAPHTGAGRQRRTDLRQLYRAAPRGGPSSCRGALAAGTSAVSSSTSSGAMSDRMSMRQPVSRAARRAFWPSLPMARDS